MIKCPIDARSFSAVSFFCDSEYAAARTHARTEGLGGPLKRWPTFRHHLRRWRLVEGLRIGVFTEVLSVVGGDARCAESVKFDRVCVVTEFLSRSFSKSFSRLFLLRVGRRGVKPSDVPHDKILRREFGL